MGVGVKIERARNMFSLCRANKNEERGKKERKGKGRKEKGRKEKNGEDVCCSEIEEEERRRRTSQS